VLHGQRFPSANPYVYCQGDSTYTTQAASCAYVNLGVGTAQGNGWLQIGWNKHRDSGASNPPLNQIYVEISDGSGLTTAQHYFIQFFSTPPSSAEYKVVRDCSTGAFTFSVGGTALTLNPINATLLATMNNGVGQSIKTNVEIHDLRSHAPGTSASKFQMTNCDYQQCGSTSWSNSLDVLVDEGYQTAIKASKSSDTMSIYDTRN